MANETPENQAAPRSETNLEDLGTLTLKYREGRPILTVQDGTSIPGEIEVENDNGQPVAVYTAGEVQATRSLQVQVSSVVDFGV